MPPPPWRRRCLKTTSIESVENSHDIFLVLLDKRIKGAVCWRGRFRLHDTVLNQHPRPVSSSSPLGAPRSPFHRLAHAGVLGDSVAALRRGVFA